MVAVTHMKIELSTLRQRQSLPLDVKVSMSVRRIREWYEYWGGKVYVSFSGGKDSTALLHLVRSQYPDVVGVFADTGLEYPEVRDFVKETENVVWVKPKYTFKEVVEKYGYPVISKEQAGYIEEYRNTQSEYLKALRWYGNVGGFKIRDRWKFLVDAPFKISSRCCDYLKKSPLKHYGKLTGYKAFVGNMAVDSLQRQTSYLQFGCNNITGKEPISYPLSFWNNENVWAYLKQNNVGYSAIYDVGYSRTGCMFCMFGIHMEQEPNRFQMMAATHPQLHNYCVNKLGCGKVMDYIGVPYE